VESELNISVIFGGADAEQNFSEEQTRSQKNETPSISAI